MKISLFGTWEKTRKYIKLVAAKNKFKTKRDISLKNDHYFL